jgi:hypothetical protein
MFNDDFAVVYLVKMDDFLVLFAKNIFCTIFYLFCSQCLKRPRYTGIRKTIDASRFIHPPSPGFQRTENQYFQNFFG